MNAPIDVATAETVAFLTKHLPRSAQVIEVGYGKGHVALALQNRGYRVIGLDADSDIAAEAKARGVPVIQATWPEFESPPVDAIAFTRSLHHVGDLQQAAQKARDMLKPEGKLLVEDFAFDAADEPTIAWFIELVRNQALVNAGASDFISELIGSDDPAAAWLHHHNHEVHSLEAMNRCIAEHFNIEEESSVSYLYRYLIPTLPATSDAAAFLQRVLQDEAERGRTGQIALIGRRIVGIPH
ncbi:MAG: methyltransferase domain-containing protein [Burkholderiaceae bacterium]